MVMIDHYQVSFVVHVFLAVVFQPNITDVMFTPPSTDFSLLLNFNNSQSMTCTASGGPRIMTMWQFNDASGSSSLTVANDSNSVTYNISSSSTSDTGTYHCIATIDDMEVTSETYTLFGKAYIQLMIHIFLFCLSSFFYIRYNQ